MAASDGTRLNLAAQLATMAADLQKTISSRKSGTDPVLLDALADVKSAARSLCSAVQKLAAEVAEEDGDG